MPDLLKELIYIDYSCECEYGDIPHNSSFSDQMNNSCDCYIAGSYLICNTKLDLKLVEYGIKHSVDEMLSDKLFVANIKSPIRNTIAILLNYSESGLTAQFAKKIYVLPNLPKADLLRFIKIKLGKFAEYPGCRSDIEIYVYEKI